jgi:prepilin signal peptidase PulO-like enzyme (type II secretory pathway)
VLGALGVVLATVDLATKRLPDALVLPSYLAGLALLGVAAALTRDGTALLRALIGMATLFGFYLLLALVNPAGLGFGDVKLSGVLGLHLAWLGWGRSCSARSPGSCSPHSAGSRCWWPGGPAGRRSCRSARSCWSAP